MGPELFWAAAGCWHGAAPGAAGEATAATHLGAGMEKHKNIHSRPAKMEHVLREARAWGWGPKAGLFWVDKLSGVLKHSEWHLGPFLYALWKH